MEMAKHRPDRTGWHFPRKARRDRSDRRWRHFVDQHPVTSDVDAVPAASFPQATRRRGAVLAIAAAAGIGVAQAVEPSPVPPLSAPIDLLAGPSATGPDAFTLGPYTFDPVTSFPTCIFSLCLGGTEGWSSFLTPPLGSVPPLFTANGAVLDTTLAGFIPVEYSLDTQDFTVYNSAGDYMGNVTGDESMIQVLGMTSYEFTIASATGEEGYTHADLPPVGAVYDIFRGLSVGVDGAGIYYNVYEATPSGVNDIFVLPSGQQFSIASPFPLDQYGEELNLSALLTQNFSSSSVPATLSQADAYANLVATSGDTGINPDAFTIDVPGMDAILAPVNDTYSTAPIDAMFPPLLAAAGANINLSVLGISINIPVITQDFTVYNSAGTNEGTFDDTVVMARVLGLTDVNDIVTSSCSNPGCPPVGTDFAVTNLTPFNTGFGSEIYVAPPPGDGPATLTFTSPLGDTTVPAFFNVNSGGVAEVDPGTVFADLVSEQAAQLHDNLITPPNSSLTAATTAFSIDDQTFYPVTSGGVQGYNPDPLTLGAPPLLAAFGGGATLDVFGLTPTFVLDTQDMYIYSGTGPSAVEQGEMTTNMVVVELPFIQSASFEVTGCSSGTCPADDTYFAVTNLLGSAYNVWESTPSGSMYDELITVLGPVALINFPADSGVTALDKAIINPAIPFDPGDIIPLHFDVPAL
jgi:hypothetical protein